MEPLLTHAPSTLVAWNPGAGRAAAAQSAFAFIKARPDAQLIETSSHEHLYELAATAAERGFQRFVVAGGDGTAHIAVNGLMQITSERPSLAIIPLGTANDFAFTLGVPDDPFEAAKLALAPFDTPIDVIATKAANRESFYLNMATGGNGDAVTRCLTPDIKQRWGAWCYIRGALDVLGNLETFQTALWFDDDTEPLEVNLWSILIANGRTNAGRLPVAPRAKPDDGLMDVIIIHDGTAVDLLELTARFITADYLEAEQVTFRRARRLRVDSSSPLPFSRDGEASEHPPTEFEVIPGAIRMVVGPEYQQL